MQATQLNRVFDGQQAAQVVGDQVGAGGEGTVYRLARRADILVKCYHPKKAGHGSQGFAEQGSGNDWPERPNGASGQ